MAKEIETVYLDINIQENTIRSTGVHFTEIYEALPRKPKNILLLNELDDYCLRDKNTSLKYVDSANFSNFVEAGEFREGDFNWICLNDLASLDKLSPQDIAELLYLAHKHRTLDGHFYAKINSSYIYFGHDDDWRILLKCRYKEDLSEIITNVLNIKIKQIKRRKFYKVNGSIAEKLLRNDSVGLLIDFENIEFTRASITIPIYGIEKGLNMDAFANEQEYYKRNSQFRRHLKLVNKCWEIDG